MNLNDRVSRYISSAEKAISQMEVSDTPITSDLPRVRHVVDLAGAYLKDAEYYREKKKFSVSLASVAYCEGLLDALKLLGAVSFEWPKKEAK